MTDEKYREQLRRKYPDKTLVRIKPNAIIRDYIPSDTIFEVGEIGRDWGNIFVSVKGGRIGFFVSPTDIIEIISTKEKVIFT